VKILGYNVYEHSNIIVKQDSGLYVYERPLELDILHDASDESVESMDIKDLANKKMSTKEAFNNYIAKFNSGDTIADLEESYIDMLFCFIDVYGRLTTLCINGMQLKKIHRNYDSVDIEGLFMWYNADIFMSEPGYISNLEVIKNDDS
jgi:hypothetical protein